MGLTAIFLDTSYVRDHLSLDSLVDESRVHFTVPDILKELSDLIIKRQERLVAKGDSLRQQLEEAWKLSRDGDYRLIADLVRTYEAHEGLTEHNPHVAGIIHEGLAAPYRLSFGTGGARHAMEDYFRSIQRAYGALFDACGVQLRTFGRGAVVGPRDAQEPTQGTRVVRMSDLEPFLDRELQVSGICMEIDALGAKTPEVSRAAMVASYFRTNRHRIIIHPMLPEIDAVAALTAKSLLHAAYEHDFSHTPFKDVDDGALVSTAKHLLFQGLHALGYSRANEDSVAVDIEMQAWSYLRGLRMKGVKSVPRNGVHADAALVSAACVLRKSRTGYEHVTVLTCDHDISTMVGLYNRIYAEPGEEISYTFIHPRK